jgi:peptide/nickel transport system substrate-binding protein
MSRKGKNTIWFLLSVLIILALVVPAACAEEAKPEIKNPDIFVEDTIGEPDSLDPAYAYDTASGELIQAIYEPLIYFKGTSTDEYAPMLATEWDVSDDGLTYRFKIREGVKFHNEDDLTPEDVEYSFERGMVQDYVAGPQWMLFEPLLERASSRGSGGTLVPLSDITSAVEVDGQWVQFNLAQKYAPFLQILCQTWSSIVDKEWCIAQGDWDGTEASYKALNSPAANQTPLNSKANGTGPFKLDSWEPGTVTMLRNDDYWGEKANFSTFVYKVVSEWTTRKLELTQGDCDWAYVDRQYINELTDVEALNLKVYQNLPQLRYDVFNFTQNINPDSNWVGSGKVDGNGIPLDFFSDKDVRIGFNYAFDWETYIQDVFLGEMTQTASPVVKGLPYFNEKQEMYSLDLAKAEEHLKAAWDGQVWEKGFKFTVTYNTGNISRKTACDILKAKLAAINPKFQVTVQQIEWSDFLDQYAQSLLPMFQIGWQADYPDPHNFVQPYMHSEGVYAAAMGYSNPDVDALIEEGIGADPDRREEIYYELQKIYHDDALGIALGQQLGRRYFKAWVKGYIFNPVDPADIGHVYKLSKKY